MRGSNRAWPSDRAALVRQQYGKIPGPELAQLAGVSIRALYRYATLHKLRKPCNRVIPTQPRKFVIASMLANIESMGKPKTQWRFLAAEGMQA